MHYLGRVDDEEVDYMLKEVHMGSCAMVVQDHWHIIFCDKNKQKVRQCNPIHYAKFIETFRDHLNSLLLTSVHGLSYSGDLI